MGVTVPSKTGNSVCWLWRVEREMDWEKRVLLKDRGFTWAVPCMIRAASMHFAKTLPVWIVSFWWVWGCALCSSWQRDPLSSQWESSQSRVVSNLIIDTQAAPHTTVIWLDRSSIVLQVSWDGAEGIGIVGLEEAFICSSGCSRQMKSSASPTSTDFATHWYPVS